MKKRTLAVLLLCCLLVSLLPVAAYATDDGLEPGVTLENTTPASTPSTETTSGGAVTQSTEGEGGNEIQQDVNENPSAGNETLSTGNEGTDSESGSNEPVTPPTENGQPNGDLPTENNTFASTNSTSVCPECASQLIYSPTDNPKQHTAKCTSCNYQRFEEHTWKDNVCQLCGYECKHDSGMKYITTETTHTATCAVCNIPQGEAANHSWKDGKCTVCQYVCTHTWKDGVCETCGLECKHDGDMKYTTTETTHTAECVVCGKTQGEAVEHSWKDGKCTVCQYVCTHTWKDGVCENCGYECKHDGDTKYTTTETTHTVVCAICGKPQGESANHAWDNSKCSVCEYVCVHSYENGVCKYCGLVCTHNWENGVCTICTLVCTHSWDNGVCTICSSVCPHSTTGYIKNEKTHTKYCTTCNMILGDAVEHSGGTATCCQMAKCADCGMPYGKINPLNHTNLQYYPGRAATVIHCGNREYWYCSGCNKYYLSADGVDPVCPVQIIIPKLPYNCKYPRTGDDSTPALWLTLFILSGATLTAAYVCTRKKTDKK